MEQLTSLPEYWYIKGCDKLIKHLKNVDNNPSQWKGDSDIMYYHIFHNNWRCDEFVPKNKKLISFQKFLQITNQNQTIEIW